MMQQDVTELFNLRKELHRIPEPAFQEVKTRDLLLKHLEVMSGLTVHRLANSTGILVEYSGGEGSYLLFRADMDGLPIPEATGCSFASQHEGFMHACGHDIHMTVLMGLIRAVLLTKPKRNLLFLFQPAEEGMGGAESVLKEGILQTYEIRHAFALHVSGSLPVGTVSSKAGIFFAIPQEFDLIFKGKAAHAAFPENGRNALSGGLEFLRRINRFIGNLQLSEPVIFNIGVMQSGSIRNIIPDLCILQGTHRTLSKQVRDLVNSELDGLSKEVAAELNLEAQLELLCTYDPVVNDETLVNLLRQACLETGADYRESRTYMTGEDFGFFTSLYPGLLFWLGGGELEHDLHSDRFLPNENCIPAGIDIFYKLIELTV